MFSQQRPGTQNLWLGGGSAPRTTGNEALPFVFCFLSEKNRMLWYKLAPGRPGRIALLLPPTPH